MIPRLCEVDMDDAEYVGDEDDGVYFTVAEHPEGWYASAIVDSNTGHFCGDPVLSDDGPYPSENEARQAGFSAGAEWCMDNGVPFEPFEESAP